MFIKKLSLLSALLLSAFAGEAQTVTVGNLTTSQNGVTTTITVPVAVALPAPVAATPVTYANLAVTGGSGTETVVFQSVGTSFTTLTLATVAIDTAAGWNPTSNVYVIPTTGTYLIVCNVRLADSVPAGVDYGIGVGSTNADGPTFVWTTTNSQRNELNTGQLLNFTAGTAVKMFVYIDSGQPVGLVGASLNIKQLP
jgi:hypothetical protein